MKYFHVGYFIVIFHTFVLTKFGFYSYLNFWNNLFYLFYQLIVFLIFLLPNTYQIITNIDSYYVLFSFVINFIEICFNYVYDFSYYIFGQIYYFLFKSSLTLGLMVFSLIMIRIINRMLIK